MRSHVLLSLFLGACVLAKRPPACSASVIDPKIVEAMKMPVERHSGIRVSFSGETQISGDWAYFGGHAFPADGSPPDGDMTLDFAALLRRDSRGDWKVLEQGFSGDPSLLVHLRKTHPEAPASIFPRNTAQIMEAWQANQD